MMTETQKEIQTKLTKGLIDIIVLQFLDKEPMHGYQIISQIRKNFGIYLGPSTVYPILNGLERKGCVSSEWTYDSKRPRKVYSLTAEGRANLMLTESSLSMLRNSL